MPKAPVSQAKAKKILSDGSIRGEPLTPKQKRFFGRIAGGAKMVRAKEGAGVKKESAAECVKEGMGIHKMADGGGTIYQSTRDRNIVEGMQEGGGLAMTSPEMYDFTTMAAQLSVLPPEQQAIVVKALTLGLESARNIHRASLGTAQPDLGRMNPLTHQQPVNFQDTLRQEVARAYQALTGLSRVPTATGTPGAVLTRTPTVPGASATPTP